MMNLFLSIISIGATNITMEVVEDSISLLQQENKFLKTEINQIQKTIDKLLELNWLQSKDNTK